MIRTLAAAAAWVDEVGLALLFPKADVVLPSLWEQVAGVTDVTWPSPEMSFLWPAKDELPATGAACVGRHLTRSVTLVAPRLVPTLVAANGEPAEGPVVDAVRDLGPLTGPQLREATGLDKRTVDREIASLHARLVLTSSHFVEGSAWGAVAHDLLARKWPLPAQLPARARRPPRAGDTCGRADGRADRRRPRGRTGLAAEGGGSHPRRGRRRPGRRGRLPHLGAAIVLRPVTIAELQEDRVVEGVYAVRMKRKLRTKSGASYLALELVDPTGHVEARVWNDVELLDGRFSEGDAVRVLARVEKFRDRLQLDVRSLESADVDPQTLTPSMRRDRDELGGFLEFLVAELTHPGLRATVEATLGDRTLQRFLRRPMTITRTQAACSSTRSGSRRSRVRRRSSTPGCAATCCSRRRSCTTSAARSSSGRARRSRSRQKDVCSGTSTSASG